VYCIHQEVGPGQWTQDLCFKTELRAFVRAKVMSKVKGCNYRVVRKATGEVVVAIEHGKVSAV
jgi:hypothetical protein